jgi:prepilin-type processing-associated H-X9-DG protein
MAPAIINGKNQMPPLQRLITIPRPPETIAMGDCAQATKPVFTSGAGYFDNTGTQWATSWVAAPSGGDLPPGIGINDPTQANKIAFGNTPNNTDDQSAGYHPRYRHNQNTIANMLQIDGHAEAYRYKSVLNRNFSTYY